MIGHRYPIPVYCTLCRNYLLFVRNCTILVQCKALNFKRWLRLYTLANHALRADITRRSSVSGSLFFFLKATALYQRAICRTEHNTLLLASNSWILQEPWPCIVYRSNRTRHTPYKICFVSFIRCPESWPERSQPCLLQPLWRPACASFPTFWSLCDKERIREPYL